MARDKISPALANWIRREEQLAPLVFNAGKTTFTPSMAKRAGAVFAGAPIVQGKGNWDGAGTPDVLTFSRGSQIVGNWYDNFDPYQGGGFVMWTPENSSGGARTGLDYIEYISAAYNLAYDYTNSRDSLTIGTQTMTYAQAIVAGTVEYISWGFDCANKLDGTNYAYLSRNDVQGYGITTQPTVSAPSATPVIGSSGSLNVANGIIEGLVFTRVVPWTGTYGTDLGRGDLVAIHAAGADIAETIGSFDTTLSVPTDAAVGALVTGEGNAWSMQHSSNLLGVGGFMADGTYTNDGYVDEGTPSAVAALAAAESIFGGWGYKVTSDAADEGIYKDVVVVPGALWKFRGIGNSDGTSVPSAILYDQTNDAEIGHLDGSTASTKAAPDVLILTGEAPAGCVLLRVKLTNTAASNIVYWHQAELYTDLWDDPSFEAGTAVTDVGTPTTSAQDAGQAHSATNSWKVVADAADEGIKRAIATTSGVFYEAQGWVYADTAGTVDMEGPTAQTGSAAKATTGSNDAWELLTFVFRATAASTDLQFTSNAAQTFYVDDVAVIALDPVSLTVTPASEANSAESGGIRVVGRSTLTQPTGNYLKANEGRVMCRVRMRHAPADLVKFVEVTGTPRIRLFRSVSVGGLNFQLYSALANRLTIYVFDSGGVSTVNADVTGLWVADEQILVDFQYRGPNAWLRINGVTVATLTTLSGFGTSVPITLYWGSDTTGVNQVDAVFIGV